MRQRPGQAPVTPDRARLNRWETARFMWQHWGVRGEFVTAAEAQATPTASKGGMLSVLRTAVRSHPAALNVFIEVTPSTGTTRAIVMSVTRERLAEHAIWLSDGARSWPFPGEVRRGRHAYYFRELVVRGGAPRVRDYRLTLGLPDGP